MAVPGHIQEIPSEKLHRGKIRSFFQSPFFIRLFHWEFWPLKVIYAPVFVYYLWLVLKKRSVFFFSTVNPGMEAGGLYGTSKFRQLKKLPKDNKPVTLLFSHTDAASRVMENWQEKGMDFPVIAKPDKAERGSGIKKIENREALHQYLEKVKAPFVIQQYIDFPFEAGVFYYRLPEQKKGQISSVVIKDFLSVTGDGSSTIDELMNNHYRTRLVKKKIMGKTGMAMDQIPDPGKKVILEPIGNHNRGTAFINGNHLISGNLEAVFDKIAGHLPEFYYGRFDLRAPSVEALLAGRNIKIMEVNGVNAEPAHIYHPGAKLWAAWSCLLDHWRIIGRISHENCKRGYRSMGFKEAFYHYREWKKSRH